MTSLSLQLPEDRPGDRLRDEFLVIGDDRWSQLEGSFRSVTVALGLYREPNEDSRLSDTTDATLYRPFVMTFNGKAGGGISKLVYIRNDDLTRRYSSIVISAVDAETPSRVDNSRDGWVWKFLEKETAPTEEEWDLITPGASHSMSADIGDTRQGDVATYLALWVRIEIPIEQSIQTITNVILTLNATETVI
jgi:hypothetical protein